MQTTKNILNDLMPLIKKPECDWSDFYFRHNIHKYVEPLYKGYDQKTANIVFAYIALAYFEGSSWLRPEKDRLENKLEIIHSLVDVEDPLPVLYANIVDNRDLVANEVINWALQFQHDWRIGMIETYRNFQSMMMSFGMSLSDDITQNINIGKALEEGQKRREMADNLQADYDKDHQLLNNALKEEKRVKLSEIPSNQLSLEQYIQLRNQRRKEQQSQQQQSGEKEEDDNE
jgi:hypothetical protein